MGKKNDIIVGFSPGVSTEGLGGDLHFGLKHFKKRQSRATFQSGLRGVKYFQMETGCPYTTSKRFKKGMKLFTYISNCLKS